MSVPKGVAKMKRQDLIAPQCYNIVEEIEKHAQDPKKNALIIYNELNFRTPKCRGIA